MFPEVNLNLDQWFSTFLKLCLAYCGGPCRQKKPFFLMLYLSGYFITEIGKETKIETCAEKWGHCCGQPAHTVQRPVGLLTGGMWKGSKVWVRKAIECWKHSLTGHSTGAQNEKMTREMLTGEAWYIRFQNWRRTSLRTYLHSACVLGTQVRLHPVPAADIAASSTWRWLGH